jgi:uncharacterized protein YbjT (DUF2867 family)
MLLLTGATGSIGSALLGRLLEQGAQVRCLVRDPRGLGAARVRVHIALGDLADPGSFRNAMRGVDTVVHLAASARDQRRASIEELAAIATWRMVEAAQRTGVKRFVLASPLGASPHHRSRLFRAKALAERVVLASELESTVLAHSLAYAPGDRWMTLLDRLATLPAVPICGDGCAELQPIWVDDLAECIVASLDRAPAPRARLELAGPETLTAAQVARLMLRALGRDRPVLPVPEPAVARVLRALGHTPAREALPSWEEAELSAVSMSTPRGSADAQLLGVAPRRVAEVLGIGD